MNFFETLQETQSFPSQLFPFPRILWRELIRGVMKDCWDWSLWGKGTAIESGPMMVQSIQVNWCWCNTQNLALAAKNTLLSYSPILSLEHCQYLLSSQRKYGPRWSLCIPPKPHPQLPRMIPDSLVSSSFVRWCRIRVPKIGRPTRTSFSADVYDLIRHVCAHPFMSHRYTYVHVTFMRVTPKMSIESVAGNGCVKRVAQKDLLSCGGRSPTKLWATRVHSDAIIILQGTRWSHANARPAWEGDNPTVWSMYLRAYMWDMKLEKFDSLDAVRWHATYCCSSFTHTHWYPALSCELFPTDRHESSSKYSIGQL